MGFNWIQTPLDCFLVAIIFLCQRQEGNNVGFGSYIGLILWNGFSNIAVAYPLVERGYFALCAAFLSQSASKAVAKNISGFAVFLLYLFGKCFGFFKTGV